MGGRFEWDEELVVGDEVRENFEKNELVVE